MHVDSVIRVFTPTVPALHSQSALAAFGVARATDTDNLTVANVFSSLALLVRLLIASCSADVFVCVGVVLVFAGSNRVH